MPRNATPSNYFLLPFKFYRWFGYSFYLLLGWGLAVQVPLMVIGGMHSRALHQAVKSMRSRRAPGTTVIEDTYRSLLWMCLAFVGSTSASFTFFPADPGSQSLTPSPGVLSPCALPSCQPF